MSLFPKSIKFYNKTTAISNNNNNKSVILPPQIFIHNKIQSKLLIYIIKTPLIFDNNNNNNSFIYGFIIENNTINGYCCVDTSNSDGKRIAGFNMIKENYVYEITDCKEIEEKYIYLYIIIIIFSISFSFSSYYVD